MEVRWRERERLQVLGYIANRRVGEVQVLHNR
jgi:hypothetical protein